MFNKKIKFTVIELVVVIAVLGILSSIVIPNVSDFRDKAYISHIKVNISEIQTAVDVYITENGSAPTSQEPTKENPQIIDMNLLYPKYLKSTPRYEETYWLDYWGTVWGSTVLPPEIELDSEEEVVSWKTISNVKKYHIYELINGSKKLAATLPSGRFDASRSFLGLFINPQGKDYIQFKTEENKRYLISAVDAYGLETAPVSEFYTGETEITIPEGETERILYITTKTRDISDWISVSKNQYTPEGTKISYDFAISDDGGKSLSDWYEDIEDVPNSKYLKVRIRLLKEDTAKESPKLYSLKINFKLLNGKLISFTPNLFTPNEYIYEDNSVGNYTEIIEHREVVNPNQRITVNISTSTPIHYIVPTISSNGRVETYYSCTIGDKTYVVNSSSLINCSSEYVDFIIRNNTKEEIVVENIIVSRKERLQVEKIVEDYLQKDEEWRVIDRFELIESLDQPVKWTSIDWKQNKSNTSDNKLTVLLRTSDDGVNWSRPIPADEIDKLKESSELKIQFISETTNVKYTSEDSIYPEDITVEYKENEERGSINKVFIKTDQGLVVNQPPKVEITTMLERLTSKDKLIWQYSVNDKENDSIVEEEWILNDVVHSIPPDGILTKGTYTISLRVKDAAGNWSNKVEKTFVVAEARRNLSLYALPAGTTAVASSTYINDRNPYKSLDLIKNTFWSSGNYAGWIEYTFPEPLEMSQFQIYNHSTPATKEDFVITGYNGKSWVTLSSYSLAIQTSATCTLHPVVNFKKDKYTKIRIQVNGHNSWVSIEEVAYN